MANLVGFGEKEPHMKVINPFVQENMPRMKLFLDQLCAQGDILVSSQGDVYPQLFQDTWLEKELEVVSGSMRQCQSKWCPDEVNPNSFFLSFRLPNIIQ